jgi:hypothetical protein
VSDAVPPAIVGSHCLDGRTRAVPVVRRIRDAGGQRRETERCVVISAWNISLGEAFLSILWFFLFFLWIWLLITIFGDLFRSDDLSGWGKAGWTALLIFLPYLGVFVYLIVRGRSMGERAAREAHERDLAMRDYVRQAAGTSSAPTAADELERLAALQQAGQISPEEYQRAKSKILA